VPKAPEPQPRSRERLRSFLRRREGQPGLRFDIDRAALRDALMIILPALALLLLNAASEVHSPSGVLQGHKEFPAARETTFPLSKQAERYLEDGPPFLQRYLSFWVANLIERMLVLLVPFFFHSAARVQDSSLAVGMALESARIPLVWRGQIFRR
jgi:hypothetical protein